MHYKMNKNSQILKKASYVWSTLALGVFLYAGVRLTEKLEYSKAPQEIVSTENTQIIQETRKTPSILEEIIKEEVRKIEASPIPETPKVQEAPPIATEIPKRNEEPTHKINPPLEEIVADPIKTAYSTLEEGKLIVPEEVFKTEGEKVTFSKTMYPCEITASDTQIINNGGVITTTDEVADICAVLDGGHTRFMQKRMGDEWGGKDQAYKTEGELYIFADEKMLKNLIGKPGIRWELLSGKTRGFKIMDPKVIQERFHNETAMDFRETNISGVYACTFQFEGRESTEGTFDRDVIITGRTEDNEKVIIPFTLLVDKGGESKFYGAKKEYPDPKILWEDAHTKYHQRISMFPKSLPQSYKKTESYAEIKWHFIVNSNNQMEEEVFLDGFNPWKRKRTIYVVGKEEGVIFLNALWKGNQDMEKVVQKFEAEVPSERVYQRENELLFVIPRLKYLDGEEELRRIEGSLDFERSWRKK